MRYKYRVSVIVPCYNVILWLNDCLQSLVNQTLKNIEIICINDGSTDGTGKCLDAWQTKYPDKIKVFHKSNAGVSVARNLGIELSQGEFIAFVDADDWVDETMFAKLYKIITANGSDCVRCNYTSYCQDTKKIKLNFAIKEDKKLNMQYLSNIKLALQVMKNACCSLFCKKFLILNNIRFIKDIYLAEDFIFILEIIFTANNIYFINDSLYYYRRKRPKQATNINDERLFVGFIVTEYVIKKILHSSNKLVINLLAKNKINQITNIFLQDHLNSSAYITTVIEKRLLLKYLSNNAHYIFRNNSIIDIYKTAINMSMTKDIRYLPFTLLLNIFFLFKKKPMPKHQWIEQAKLLLKNNP